jgi:hypothetical protein
MAMEGTPRTVVPLATPTPAVLRERSPAHVSSPSTQSMRRSRRSNARQEPGFG